MQILIEKKGHCLINEESNFDAKIAFKKLIHLNVV